MPPRRFDFHKILVAPKFVFRKPDVRYLVLVNWHAQELDNIIKRPADAGFDKFVEKHVQSYLEGTAPPEAIQTAILNIVDDVAAGRDTTLRAGDYIALQTQYRAER